MIASSGNSLKFHQWPVEDYELTYKPSVSSKIICTSWSNDNNFLTFLGEHTRPEIISLKDVNKIKSVHTITALDDVSAVNFQRTTKRLLGVGTHHGQVLLYDTKLKTIGKLLANVPRPIHFLDFNAADETVAYSGEEFVGIQSLSQKGISNTYSPENENGYAMSAMKFHSREANVLATANENGVVSVWDTSTGQKLFCMQAHTASVRGLGFASGSDLLLSASEDRKLCVHNISMHECVFHSNFRQPLTALDVNCDGITIAIGAQDGYMYVYDLRKLLQPVVEFKAHDIEISTICFENQVKSDFIFEPSVEKTPSFSKLPKPNFEGVANSIPGSVECSRLEKGETVQGKNKISINSIKKDIEEAINCSAERMYGHVKEQFQTLHNFFINEVNIIDEQMEDKWEHIHEAYKQANYYTDIVTIISQTRKSLS